MWCRQCQQDVPVMRGGAGAAACPRCRKPIAAPADDGVELGSFDAAPAWTPASRRWDLDDAAVELQRIGRRLRPAANHPVEVIYHATPAAEMPRTSPRPLMDTAAKLRTKKPSLPEAPAARMSGASLVADLGLVAAIAGAATLAGQMQGMLAPEVWPWGVGQAAVGAGLFAIGLFRLAMQTSQECRRLAREVDALRKQLKECEQREQASPAPLASAPASGRGLKYAAAGVAQPPGRARG
jgi:hypothetical protein